ncbi:MAG: MqnA/MqnD/SBP family protein [Bacteroidota bacterium]
MKSLLGVSEASYVQPLLYGLETPESPFQLLIDIPAETAIKLRERIENLRCAFLSPIDYARHGADYRIVPGVSVSSSIRTDTIQLFINPDARDIKSVAVDVRVTSEIILAKIILIEKFPNLTSVEGPFQFVPMAPNLREMLKKADAALAVNLHPHRLSPEEPFALDLVEEWSDLTGLPYVHGFWVGHENPETEQLVPNLIRAKQNGVEHLHELTQRLAQQRSLSAEHASRYLSSFSFGFGRDEEESLSEFIRYAYYHGILPDVPDINCFEIDSP